MRQRLKACVVGAIGFIGVAGVDPNVGNPTSDTPVNREAPPTSRQVRHAFGGSVPTPETRSKSGRFVLVVRPEWATAQKSGALRSIGSLVGAFLVGVLAGGDAEIARSIVAVGVEAVITDRSSKASVVAYVGEPNRLTDATLERIRSDVELLDDDGIYGRYFSPGAADQPISGR